MVGCDLCLAKRIEKAMKDKNFLRTFLCEQEINYVMAKTELNDARAMTAAGLFSAKEAVLKAFKVGITHGYGLKDVEIYHDELGAPVVKLSEKLNALLTTLKKSKVEVSISHDGDYAFAVAIIL